VLLDLLGQLRRDGEQVTYDAEVGASLLIATIVLDVCMPARCWIAPEMPTAM
jgi:hypothetical protein